MISSEQLQIIGGIAIVLLGANLLAMALFVLFVKLPIGKLRDKIHNIIYELDKFTDNMENKQKRAVAIQDISALLGVWGIFIPSALIGWVFDTESAVIRQMQQLAGTPSLPDDKATITSLGTNLRLVTLTDIKHMAITAKPALAAAAQSYGWPIKVYYHWTAGHYDQFFNDYHFNIAKNGSVYATTNNLSERKNHTYRRNVGSIGIAMACAFNAISANNLGPEPPTSLQIEATAQITAVLSDALGIPIDIKHFMTHAEAADNMDGCNPGYEANGYPEGKYGPQNSVERWDLWVVKEGDTPGSGGSILRGKGIWYQQRQII